MISPTQSCKNCNQSFQGKYCNHCGQAVIDRFSLRYLWKLLHQDLFEVDQGLWHTMKDLTVRPGYMIRNYLAGKTKSYFSPLKYLLVFIAIFYLINSFTEKSGLSVIGPTSNDWPREYIFNSHQPFSADTLSNFLGLIGVLLAQNLTLYFLLMLPFVALISNALFKPLNYTEHLITWTFMWGHVMLGMIIIIPAEFMLTGFSMIASMALEGIMIILMICFFFVTFKQLTEITWWRVFVKVFGSLYGGMLLFFGTTLLFFILFKLIFVN